MNIGNDMHTMKGAKQWQPSGAVRERKKLLRCAGTPLGPTSRLGTLVPLADGTLPRPKTGSVICAGWPRQSRQGR